MKCPFCAHTNTSVKDSRSIDGDSAIRRRRHCLDCNARFTTVEHVQLLSLKVVKKTGRIEPFSREKLLKSLGLALHKRPIEPERKEKILNSLVRQLESLGDSEIPSPVIGELVMQTLLDLDPVAYIRFASIYQNFHHPDDFKEFVRQLSKKTGQEID
jgi:transcriptional repressor NrdR